MTKKINNNDKAKETIVIKDNEYKEEEITKKERDKTKAEAKVNKTAGTLALATLLAISKRISLLSVLRSFLSFKISLLPLTLL